MKGTKYLSDVLDVSQLRTGTLNIINAPCGCGKTTCAINKIAELASSPRKVLYLIDTRIGKERLAREPGLIKPCVFIDGPLDGEPWEKKLVYELRQEKIPVMTYALFGILCSDSPDFIKRFEIIICDEPQSLVFFSKNRECQTERNRRSQSRPFCHLQKRLSWKDSFRRHHSHAATARRNGVHKAKRPHRPNRPPPLRRTGNDSLRPHRRRTKRHSPGPARRAIRAARPYIDKIRENAPRPRLSSADTLEQELRNPLERRAARRMESHH